MLSHDDVRRILDWNLEYFRAKGVSGNGSSSRAGARSSWAVRRRSDWVLGRAQAAGTTYTAAQVHAVLDAQMEYLEAIGAIGPEAPPEDGGPPSGRPAS